MSRFTTPCYCQNIRHAANAMTQGYDRAMKSLGLTANQHSLLRFVERLAPCTTTQLAESLGLDRTTLARNLKPLLKKGWLEDTSEEGSRNHQFRLSQAGKEQLAKAIPLWQEMQNRVAQTLGEEKLRTFMETLHQMEEIFDSI